MKNIHILSTDEQIKNVGDVVKDLYGDIHIFTKKNEGKEYVKTITKLNIYITSDEEIKEGDWCYDSDGKQILQFNNKIVVLLANQQKEKYGVKSFFKIILTTDQDLIKDGVQAIDIEFLEWFVKNPSCEEVEIDTIETLTGSFDAKGIKSNYVNVYKIIIPKEEPKKNWYCAKCESYVSFESVTFEETHQICNTGVIIEEDKQETLEDAAERLYPDCNNVLRQMAKETFIEGAKWQSERSYSEEEVIAFGEFIFKHTLLAHSKGVKNLFEQFKNK